MTSVWFAYAIVAAITLVGLAVMVVEHEHRRRLRIAFRPDAEDTHGR